MSGNTPTSPDEGAPENTNPRIFISYAWTDASHQEWVVSLATSLQRDGVEVILDVWDLGPGQDKFHFMEQMVTDSKVERVLLICNASYAAKADGRKGGVGDETQILTPKIYSDIESDKFVPVLSERDSDGRPFLPSYLKSRIYIDLSTEQSYYDEYERLLRLIYGAPAFSRPALGEKPDFLKEASVAAGSSNSPGLRRAIHALEAGKRGATTHAKSCLDEIRGSVVSLRVKGAAGPIDEEVFQAIRKGKIHRDEFVALVEALCSFLDSDDELVKLLATYFEKMLEGCYQQEVGSWRDTEFDGVRFLAMETFLYTVAILLEFGRFDVLQGILTEKFVFRRTGGTRRKSDWSALFFGISSLEDERKRRLGSRRISLVADLFKERADRSNYPFTRVQEVDLLLFVRTRLLEERQWLPRTLVFLSDEPEPLPLFLSPESRQRFLQLRAVLGVKSVQELLGKLERAFPPGRDAELQLGGHWPISLRSLLNLRSDNR